MADVVIFVLARSRGREVYIDAHGEDRIVGFTAIANMRKPSAPRSPLVRGKNLNDFFPPQQVKLLGPLSYRRMNEFRRIRYLEGKRRNYQFTSFIHPDSAHLYDRIGEECLILEANIVQPYARIATIFE